MDEKPAEAAKPHPKELMLRAAIPLFRTRGYAGVGMAELIAASGFPRGSLYFHFPGGKEQIAAEAMAMAGARDSARYAAHVEASTTLEGFVNGIFTTSAEVLARSGYARGCGVGLIALEMSNESEGLRMAAKAVLDAWRDGLAAGFAKFGHAPAQAQKLGTATLASLQGAIVLARATRSGEPFGAAAQAILAMSASR